MYNTFVNGCPLSDDVKLDAMCARNPLPSPIAPSANWQQQEEEEEVKKKGGRGGRPQLQAIYDPGPDDTKRFYVG